VPLFRCFGRLYHRLHTAGVQHGFWLLSLASHVTQLCATHMQPTSKLLNTSLWDSALTYLTPGSIRTSRHQHPPHPAPRVAQNRLSANHPFLSLLSITTPLGRCLCTLSSAGFSRGSVRVVPAVRGPCPVSNISRTPLHKRPGPNTFHADKHQPTF
jgi:hypothetical protein